MPNVSDMIGGFRHLSTGQSAGQMGAEWGNTSGEIRPHPDFNRVFALPRKRKQDWEAIAAELTRQLKTPDGDWALRAIQAEVLISLAENRGCFASVGVGGGKTIMSFLAGTICDARDVAIIVPAKLREKTKRDFAALAEKFHVTSRHHILSAEEIGLKDGMDRLSETGAQLIVIDECHKFKNTRAARTRKILRYLAENTGCRLLAMSGTVTDRSIKDFAHLLGQALGELRSPLPTDKDWLGKWARLVDPNVDGRMRPGVFVQKLPKDVDPRDATPEHYRDIVHKRIFSTEGVVKLPNASYGGPIEISFIEPAIDQRVLDLMRQLEGGTGPNGDEVYPIEHYRIHRCLAMGFWYDWDPRPPDHWLRARRNWRSWCRTVLETEIYGLDSELMVINAVDRGWYVREGGDKENPGDRIEITDDGLLEKWRSVKGDYQGTQFPVWETEDILREAIELSGALKDPMLVWTEFRAVGDKLNQIFDLPYYANKGMTKGGDYIGDCPGNVSPVLSLAANSEGLNLQDRWFRALYLTPMQSASAYEQSIGRIHRPGQTADACEIQIVANTEKLREAFWKACDYAKYQETMTGAPQKLTLADIA